MTLKILGPSSLPPSGGSGVLAAPQDQRPKGLALKALDHNRSLFEPRPVSPPKNPLNNPFLNLFVEWSLVTSATFFDQPIRLVMKDIAQKALSHIEDFVHADLQERINDPSTLLSCKDLRALDVALSTAVREGAYCNPKPLALYIKIFESFLKIPSQLHEISPLEVLQANPHKKAAFIEAFGPLLTCGHLPYFEKSTPKDFLQQILIEYIKSSGATREAKSALFQFTFCLEDDEPIEITAGKFKQPDLHFLEGLITLHKKTLEIKTEVKVEDIGFEYVYGPNIPLKFIYALTETKEAYHPPLSIEDSALMVSYLDLISEVFISAHNMIGYVDKKIRPVKKKAELKDLWPQHDAILDLCERHAKNPFETQIFILNQFIHKNMRLLKSDRIHTISAFDKILQSLHVIEKTIKHESHAFLAIEQCLSSLLKDIKALPHEKKCCYDMTVLPVVQTGLNAILPFSWHLQKKVATIRAMIQTSLEAHKALHLDEIEAYDPLRLIADLEADDLESKVVPPAKKSAAVTKGSGSAQAVVTESKPLVIEAASMGPLCEPASKTKKVYHGLFKSASLILDLSFLKPSTGHEYELEAAQHLPLLGMGLEIAHTAFLAKDVATFKSSILSLAIDHYLILEQTIKSDIFEITHELPRSIHGLVKLSKLMDEKNTGFEEIDLGLMWARYPQAADKFYRATSRKHPELLAMILETLSLKNLEEPASLERASTIFDFFQSHALKATKFALKITDDAPDREFCELSKPPLEAPAPLDEPVITFLSDFEATLTTSDRILDFLLAKPRLCLDTKRYLQEAKIQLIHLHSAKNLMRQGLQPQKQFWIHRLLVSGLDRIFERLYTAAAICQGLGEFHSHKYLETIRALVKPALEKSGFDLLSPFNLGNGAHYFSLNKKTNPLIQSLHETFGCLNLEKGFAFAGAKAPKVILDLKLLKDVLKCLELFNKEALTLIKQIEG